MPIKGMDTATRSITSQVYEVAHRRATAGMRKALGFARSRWPVGRNQGRAHSRDLFELRDTSDGRTRINIAIWNDAKDDNGTPYAFFIRSARVPGAGKRNAWTVLVRRPVLKLTGELARETARDPRGARG